jgi:hypothetical protein
LSLADKFYPGSGEENKEDFQHNIVNVVLTPIGPGPWDYQGRAKLTNPKREALCKQASEEFR